MASPAGPASSFSDEWPRSSVGEIYGIPQVARDLHGHGDRSGRLAWCRQLVATRDLQVGCAGGHPLLTVPFLSSLPRSSGKHVPVRMFCTYLTCSGDAKLTSKSGVVLASAPYSLQRRALEAQVRVKLRLTPAGSKALAMAKEHPVDEYLVVTVRGAKGVITTLHVS